MDIRLLESFLAIVEERHFGRAAARLHLAQPTLSQHLQRLEQSVGAKLVDRSSHAVELTDAGSAFEPNARAVLSHLSKATRSARAAAEGHLGSLAVGFNFAAAHHILPATLQHLRHRHPGVRVHLEELRSGPQLTALADGRLDVGLLYGPPTAPDLRSRPLMSLRLCGVVGPMHRWAHRPAAPFMELARHPCVLFDRGQSPAMYDAIQQAAAQAGIELDVAELADDPAATGVLVRAHQLVTFASESRAVQLARSGSGLTPVRLHGPVPMLDLHAAWHADNGSPLLQLFLDTLEASGTSRGTATLSKPTAASVQA
ncbi:LysR family transcriptional regulator [Nocardioides sp. KC13]|uniref:LysR family transcriptional regulator n=1 Tax=Nocardioides turkmenicus TaxID=2711220 RepID=A0A6M1R2L4_9ACTN|nr:LysR family transcriptional regulator [Nocardioides sp. KC13]NGN91989.1 LysR family transcriptional regulator [Nocardioides sp. KC13]